MSFEIGNLDKLHAQHPNLRGWCVGSFVEDPSLRHSEACEVKWARHPKGLKKTSGDSLDLSTRTMVILLHGKWKTFFPENQQEIVQSQPGDYLIYEGAQHENEALEDSHLMIVRWYA